MTGIAIVTDSTANPPAEWIFRYGPTIVPLKVHWGEKTYRDGVDERG